MAVTQYIGSRYVPLFADPIEWSSAKEYEPLTIVLHEGNSYTSKQFVPVGININNEKFWAETGNYNAQIEQYRHEVLEYRDYFKQKSFVFDTVADMQASDALYVDAICHTNGFHTSGDGGAAWYVISDSGGANDMDVLMLRDGLVATLVITPIMQTAQFGMSNNWQDLQHILDICVAGSCSHLYVNEGTYVLNLRENPSRENPTRVLLKNVDGFTIEGIGTVTVNMQDMTRYHNATISDGSGEGRDFYTGISCTLCDNVHIKNLTFVGSQSAYESFDYDTDAKWNYNGVRAKAIGFLGTRNSTIENITGMYIMGNTVNVTPSSASLDGTWRESNGITIENCTSLYSCEDGFDLMAGCWKCLISNCYAYASLAACYEEAGWNTQEVAGNIITNCIARLNGEAGYGFVVSGHKSILKDSCVYCNSSINKRGLGISVQGSYIVVDNVECYNLPSRALFVYPSVTNCTIQNCTFIGCSKRGSAHYAGFSFEIVMYAVGSSDKIINNLTIQNNQVFLPDPNDYAMDVDAEVLLFNFNFVTNLIFRGNHVVTAWSKRNYTGIIGNAVAKGYIVDNIITSQISIASTATDIIYKNNIINGAFQTT